MTHSQRYNVYISSCCENGGIYHCSFDESNGLEIIEKIPLDEAVAMVMRNEIQDSKTQIALLKTKLLLEKGL